jgi:hypothetical protein
MSYKERIRYASFLDNKEEIEAKWDKQFGDRQNELVIIGKGLNKESIIRELDDCLCDENEIAAMERGDTFYDAFPC